MALNSPVNTSDGGKVYRPANGMYRGEFVGIEDAGLMKSAFSDEPRAKVRFRFALSDFNTGEAVIDPETGEQAVYGALVNDSTHINSTAYRYALIITGSDSLEDCPDLGAELDANIGRVVTLTFANGKQNNKPGALRDIMPFAQAPR